MTETGGVPEVPWRIQPSLLIGEKYRLVRKIGGGSFGDIYHAICTSNGEECAVKMEKSDVKQPQLLIERKLMKTLAGGEGIPNFRWFGVENGYSFLVMDLLGPSLEDLLTFCSRRFSLKTVLMLADQMIARVEFIHRHGYLHRDLKPDNFLMGVGQNQDKVYMIDYGLSKRFQDSRTKYHIPYREGKSLSGTARYCSVNAHLGVEQSRRDDLEALGYTFVYFFGGNLPWMGIQASNDKKKQKMVCEKKWGTPVDVLCRGLPGEFGIYLNYCRSLGFDEEPDYGYLRKLFRALGDRMGYQWDYQFDWTVGTDEVREQPEA